MLGPEHSNSNSNTFIMKGSSVRSIWIYLTAIILQTDIISTNKQLITAVSQSSYKCAETSELKFLHGYTCIHAYNTQNFRQTCDSNNYVQVWRKVILRHILVQIKFETRKKNTGFYVLRQGVPEGRSSEWYTSFKQIKLWPWHVEVIPGVSVVGLVANKELCQVVSGIIIKTFMHKYSFKWAVAVGMKFQVH